MEDGGSKVDRPISAGGTGFSFSFLLGRHLECIRLIISSTL